LTLETGLIAKAKAQGSVHRNVGPLALVVLYFLLYE
jgi:hypothetical protein